MGILDFFSKEAGQARTRALNEAVAPYIPPELRGLLSLGNELNPYTNVARAGQSAEAMTAPGISGWDRMGHAGNMASEMAAVLAPALLASRTGMPAYQAIEEGLLGVSSGPKSGADYFLADESGALRTGAKSPAQEVADLLASGRAADVTDEMLAKLTPKDNAELFKLYQSGATGMDMPMDAASRMQRAEGMGFDTGTPLYHGTAADIQAFVPSESGKFGAGVYTSPEPSMAEKYMDMRDGDGKNDMQVFNRGDRLRLDGEFTQDQKQRLKLPKRVGTPDDLWPPDVTAEQFYADLNKRAAKGGYTAKEYGSPYQEVVTTNPANIRSRFARFDPRLSHLANLSAGAAGLLALFGLPDDAQAQGPQ